jgi:hypothetical protein
MRKTSFILAGLISLLCVANANATTITFFETATVSGSLNGVSFTDAFITITGVGNTANTLSGQTCCFSNSIGTATFTLAGNGSGIIGSGTFLDSIRVVVNQNTLFGNPGQITGHAGAGFSDFTIGTEILWTQGDSPFSNYALVTNISVTGAAVLGLINLQIPSFSTTAGSLFITASTSTFTAVLSEVPLPGALPLFATGLGALGLLGWRRKRKAQAA